MGLRRLIPNSQIILDSLVRSPYSYDLTFQQHLPESPEETDEDEELHNDNVHGDDDDDDEEEVELNMSNQ